MYSVLRVSMGPGNRPRFLLASITAPLPAVLALVGLCVAAVWFPELPREGVPVDNAPVRAAGVVLMLSPLLYVVTAALFFGITKAVAALRILSRRNLLALAGASSLGLGTWAAGDRQFGWHDSLVALAVFGTLAFGFLTSVAFTWWWVGHLSRAGPSPSAEARGLP